MLDKKFEKKLLEKQNHLKKSKKLSQLFLDIL